MFLFRKNIILVPSDYDGVSLTKGLLSLDCFEGKTECTLRCYNLYTDGPLLLGISINNVLHKIDVKGSELKNFKFKIDKTIKNGDEVSCVLINFKNNNYNILLWGSTQLNSGWKTTLEFMLEDELSQTDKKKNLSPNKNVSNAPKQESFEKAESFKTSKSSPYEFAIEQPEKFLRPSISQDDFCCRKTFDDTFRSENFGDYSNESHNKFNYDKGIECESANTNFKNNDAEIYTYEDEKINQLIDKVIDMTEDREKQNIKQDADDLSFYERINPQISKMFENNKEETVLNEILPNSKFCRVEFEDGSGYYVFGVIYEDGLPKYVCYGLPAQKNSEPPKELSNLYQWLPIDATDETGDGYYMMYQDAITGKNMSVEII